jgi:hypothetical protein
MYNTYIRPLLVQAQTADCALSNIRFFQTTVDSHSQRITDTDICIFVHICVHSFRRCYTRFGAYPNYTHIKIFVKITCKCFFYGTYIRPLLVQTHNSRLCPINCSSGCNTSLITWTVICLTTPKFKFLIFCVNKSQSWSYITADSQSANPSWCQAPIWDPQPIFPFSLWLFLDSCGFVDVGRPLWREDRSVICSAMAQVQLGLMTRS